MPPESGSSMPASILSSVVLPAPFGPHRPTRSPSPICHVTWSSRTRSPNDFVRSESWITAGGSGLTPNSQHTNTRSATPNHLGSWLRDQARRWEFAARRAARSGSYAESPGGGRQNLRHAKWLREVAGHPEVDRFDGADLGRKAGDDDHGHLGPHLLHLANQHQPVHPGHLQIDDGQIARRAGVTQARE